MYCNWISKILSDLNFPDKTPIVTPRSQSFYIRLYPSDSLLITTCTTPSGLRPFNISYGYTPFFLFLIIVFSTNLYSHTQNDCRLLYERQFDYWYYFIFLILSPCKWLTATERVYYHTRSIGTIIRWRVRVLDRVRAFVTNDIWWWWWSVRRYCLTNFYCYYDMMCVRL